MAGVRLLLVSLQFSDLIKLMLKCLIAMAITCHFNTYDMSEARDLV